MRISTIKHAAWLAATAFILASCGVATHENGPLRVRMRTTAGDIVVELDDRAPRHRDNFAGLAREGYFDSLLFHRVIEGFMIQGGDPRTRDITGAEFDAEGPETGDRRYWEDIEAEIRYPELYHRRGALAAAREGDALNPERRSSGSQFYIVTGRVHNDSTLTAARHRIAAGAADPAGAQITPQRERVYRTAGGAPHLDGSYTVFGEVIGGMGRVVRISKLPTDSQDRPKNEDVYIKSMTVKVVKDRRRDR